MIAAQQNLSELFFTNPNNYGPLSTTDQESSNERTSKVSHSYPTTKCAMKMGLKFLGLSVVLMLITFALVNKNQNDSASG